MNTPEPPSYPLQSPANDAGAPMDLALDLARQASARGEVPVGCVIVDGRSGRILARAHNLTETQTDPTAHAEILALREAALHGGSPRLPDADLYVTLEPCPMCAQAISFARIRRLVFGAYDPKGGGVEHGPRIFDSTSCHHAPEIIGGVRETAAAALLQDFFKPRR